MQRSTTGQQLLLRKVDPNTEPFLFEVFTAVRGQPLLQAGLPPSQLIDLLRIQFRAQLGQYRALYPSACYSVVEWAGRATGYLYVDRSPAALRLVDIALLPVHQSQGLGTQLVQQLSAEADGAGLSIHAHVEKKSRAWPLWQRLGFQIEGDEGVYWAIRRSPQQPASP